MIDLNKISHEVLNIYNSIIRDDYLEDRYEYTVEELAPTYGINEEDAEILRQIRYDGRPDLESPWADQNIQLFGYHYQMTYETAEMGVNKFQEAVYREPKQWTWKDYPNLSEYKIFEKGVLH